MKNHEVRIRMSQEEKEKITRKATRFGMNLSSYLRLLGLASDIKPTNEED